jgi:hypothetical protein
LHQVDTQVLNLIHIWYLGTAVPRYPVLLLLPLLLLFSNVTFFFFRTLPVARRGVFGVGALANVVNKS